MDNDNKKQTQLFDWDDEEDVEDAPTVVMPHRQFKAPKPEKKFFNGFLDWFWGDGVD